MKTKLAAFLLALSTALSFGHGGVELGPNGGRLLEFSKNESMHGEVTVVEGKFHVTLLDKDLKPVKAEAQTLTATGGTREKPEKLTVTKDDTGFTVPLIKEGQWLIVQFKEGEKAKAVTARFEYNTSLCEACQKAEWLCECKPEKEEKKDTGKKETKKEPKKGK